MIDMKKILLVLVVVASFAACQTADRKQTVTEATTPGQALQDSANYTSIQWLDSTFQDLGKVKDGQVVEVSYRFKNTGTKSLVIANVSASCGCTVPEKPEKPIGPGEEGVIKAKFDSKGRPHGENRKTVYVDANTTPNQSQLSFKVEITD